MSPALVGGFFTTGAIWETPDESVSLSVVPDSVTTWTVARQTSLSMGFYRQEYWSGLPCPPPEDLPHPGIEPTSLKSPALQTDSLPSEVVE